MPALLEVEDLAVSYRTGRGTLRAVDGVSLKLDAGETLGLVGESGCGKSSLGKAIMRLLSPSGGAIRLRGVEIGSLPVRRLKPFRKHLQMVFQDPSGSLDPRHRVGRLIAEPMIAQGAKAREVRERRVPELLMRVGLNAELVDRFPHELSGGQRQRVGIARAIALEPSIVVCDEPVSALDVSLQAQVLNLLADIQRERGLAYLFISHDLSVVQHMADRIAVMYLGKIVELASREAMWRRPAHPYTQALIGSVPTMDPRRGRIDETEVLAGDLPSPYAPPSGCRFHTRCPIAVERCRREPPPLMPLAADHSVACHLAGAVTASAV